VAACADAANDAGVYGEIDPLLKEIETATHKACPFLGVVHDSQGSMHTAV